MLKFTQFIVFQSICNILLYTAYYTISLKRDNAAIFLKTKYLSCIKFSFVDFLYMYILFWLYK